MNSNRGRERKTRREPDVPVESKIVSVDRVDPADAGDAFHPHGGRDAEINDHRYVLKLENALESGEWSTFRAVYRTYIPRIWQWENEGVANVIDDVVDGGDA